MNTFLNKIKPLFQLYKYYLIPKDNCTYAQDLLYTYNNADFMKEKKFIESYTQGKNTVKGSSLLKSDIHWRIHVLCWAGYHAKQLEGDFVDCGVNTGIFAKSVMHYIDFNTLKKTYYLLDTFCGMDSKYSSSYEMERSQTLKYGQQKNIIREVKKTFSDYNTKIIVGSVPETLSQVTSKKICYLSIDMNCVQPEIAALNFFWDKMVSGGIIILDDYGYPGCIDQKNAHDNFAKSKHSMILSLPTCQGVLIKP